MRYLVPKQEGNGSIDERETMLLVSETISDFIIKIINLPYLGVNVHVASKRHFGGLCGPASLQMTSEVANDLGIELSGLNYLCKHAFLCSKCLYGLNQRRRRRIPIVIH